MRFEAVLFYRHCGLSMGEQDGAVVGVFWHLPSGLGDIKCTLPAALM